MMTTKSIYPAVAAHSPPENAAAERANIAHRFGEMLSAAPGDGSKKRQAGTKPPWHSDRSHEAAMYRHLERWETGEKHDLRGVFIGYGPLKLELKVKTPPQHTNGLA